MPHSLIPALRISLDAKLQRLLERPLVGALPVRSRTPIRPPQGPPWLRAVDRVIRDVGRPEPLTVDAEEADGTVWIPIAIDYEDRWRGCEKEVLRSFRECLEGPIPLLTEEQERLLRTSPSEFLVLSPGPATAELVELREERVGRSQRVVAIRLGRMPEERRGLAFAAIVPNLIPLQRQLEALRTLEKADPVGPLAALRALCGLQDELRVEHPVDRPLIVKPSGGTGTLGSRFDEFQRTCLEKAESSPHFAVIEGPPGSGKTAVISAYLERVLSSGARALVVSSTHVAVDNVVERLVDPESRKGRDTLPPHTLPIRYASRPRAVSDRARPYWVGGKSQQRAATIAERVETTLCEKWPDAKRLFRAVDPNQAGEAPISAAVSAAAPLICGTPIGILSCREVKEASPADFDVLVVDEVSKMTLPEFLAVAVKAKKWVLVGDPAQLPPYNDAAENAVTLDDIVEPIAEIATTVVECATDRRNGLDRGNRFVVIAKDPAWVRDAVDYQAEALGEAARVAVATADDWSGEPIVVCTLATLDATLDMVEPRWSPRASERRGTVWLVAERGIRLARPPRDSGRRLIDETERFQARVFSCGFHVYHALPWSLRARHPLQVVKRRKHLERLAVTNALVGSVAEGLTQETDVGNVESRMVRLAERFAVNALSVFDWLVVQLGAEFDSAPLGYLRAFDRPGLREAVRPYVGRLEKQYRMHPSLSAVPRTMFYFGAALRDGKTWADASPRVRLIRASGVDAEEHNVDEAEAIVNVLEQIAATAHADDANSPTVLVITPYREQERLLHDYLEGAVRRGDLASIRPDVCTLDRCQGREADYVFISLVKSRASLFLDNPKRWNVALTRAKDGLILVGDIDAYLEEARRIPAGGMHRHDAKVPIPSIVAHFVRAYADQIEGGR